MGRKNISRRGAEAQRFHVRLWPVFCLAAALGGCGYPPPATYGPMTAIEARAVLSQRAGRVQTVSAPDAEVVMTRPDGQSIRLDTILVMRPPDWMHLHAEKFGQAVFDLTITPAGVWLMQPPPDAPSAAEKTPAPTSGPFDRPGVGRQLSAMWGLLTGGLFGAEASWADQAIDRGSGFEYRHVQSDGMTIVCQVDKRTITPSMYRLYDADGAERFTLELDKYVSIDGIAWPMKIVARQLDSGADPASAGTIEVDFGTVELNAALADGAFTPPRRARKLP